jgi:hypothetical protein
MKLRTGLGLAIALHAASAQAACDTAYALNGDTVFDKRSGLTWQRCSVGQRWQEGAGCTGAPKFFTWFDAAEQPVEGWRLPSADELASLIHPGCQPVIDGRAFPGIDPDYPNYWTATTAGDSAAYYVNFATGIATVDARDEPYAVRLVRGGK